MTKFLILTLAAALMLMTPHAGYSKRVAVAGCGKLTINANLNVTISGRKDTLKEAKAYFDQQVDVIHDYLTKQGVEKVNITSMNYNLNPNMRYDSYGQPDKAEYYQVNGNLQIQLKDEAQAISLAELLIEKGMQASVNVSSYKGGGVCPQEEILE